MKTVYPHPRITTSSHHHIITSSHHHIITSPHHHITTLAFSFLIFSSLFSFAQTPTWKNITPPGWSGIFKQVVYSATNGLVALADNGYLYTSKDTARTWTPYQTPDTAMTAITMYPDNTTGFIQNEKSVYKTKDGLKTWTKLPLTGISSDMQIRTVWIKNADTVLLVATNLENGLRIFLSKDTAKTWTQVAQNILNSATYINIYGFYFPTPLIGYGYGYGCYVSTTDGGKTWVNQPLSYNERDNYYSSTYSYPNGKTIIFYRDWYNNQNTIYTSPDGNPATMTQVGTTTETVTNITGFGATVYAIDNGNLYYSSDSGNTWQTKAIPHSNLSLTSMCFFSKALGVGVGTSLTSMVTADSGTTWTKYVYGGAEGFKNIYCKTANECYITGSTGRLFHTTDGGNTWNFRDLQSSKIVQVLFPTNDTGYISTSSYIYRSIDTGNTWTKFKQGTGGGFIYFPSKDTGFAGFDSGGTLDKTIDAGQTWNIAADMTYINNIGSGVSCAYFRSTTEGLIGGTNVLLHTIDGGNSWQAIKKSLGGVKSILSYPNNGWLIFGGSTSDSVTVYICDKDFNCTMQSSLGIGGYEYHGAFQKDSSTYYICAGDTMFQSTDGGKSWKTADLWGESLSLSFPSNNIGYSIGTGIIKIFYPTQLTATINRQNDRNYDVTISNNGFKDTVIIVLLKNDSVYYQYTTLMVNGTPFTINIPKDISSGDGYTIKVIPTDTVQYTSVQSSVFSIAKDTTGVGIVNQEQPKEYIIQGHRIVVQGNQEVDIYTLLGQKLCSVLNGEISLPTGFYIVKCNNTIQKVIIIK